MRSLFYLILILLSPGLGFAEADRCYVYETTLNLDPKST